MIRTSICAASIIALVVATYDSSHIQAAEGGNLADLIDKIEPSVVRIDVITKGESKGIGSGYVVAEDGTVVTNYHVMSGATAATAVFKNGEKYDVKGTLLLDAKRDIAILKIDKQGLAPLPLADKLPRKGDSVAAFGAPVGLSFSASEGIVSAIRDGKELSDDDPLPGTWIQTTAPISPGNSGGPLVNREGQVVAMNTMVLLIGQNLNFAISSVDVADALKKSTGRKLIELADGAAKAKPNKRTSKAKNEIAAKDIPAASLSSYVAGGQKNYRQAVADARKRLTEAKEVLRGMRDGSTNNTIAMAAKADGVEGYTMQMFQGKKYYHFPDLATKEKCIGIQQKEVDKNDELVKKLDDKQQGVLNYLKNGGPELQLKTVGDVGFVKDLLVFLISDDDEFHGYLGDLPVTVRGMSTDKLAIGSKLDGKVMFVSGTESYATRIEGSKVNIFVLREVPDEVLLDHLKSPGDSGGTPAGKISTAAAGTTKAGATSGTATTGAAPKDADFRTWSDKTGKYKLDAQLIAKDSEKIVLKRHDNGQIITLAIEKLSQADQDFLKTSGGNSR